MRRLAAFVVLTMLLAAGAAADLDPRWITNVPTTVLPGVYTVATLPACAQNQGRYAFTTDLGGGADTVICDGTNWKHIRQGVVTDVAVQTAITVTPLASPPVIRLTSSNAGGFVGSSSITINTVGLYPGYTLQLVAPSGAISTVAGALGTVGLGVSGSPQVPIVSGSWQDIQWNGTQLVVLRKGTL